MRGANLMTILIDTPQNATPPDFFIRFMEKVQRETTKPRTPEEIHRTRVMLDGLKRAGERAARAARHSLQIAKEKAARRFLWRARGAGRTHRAQRTPSSHKTDSGPKGGDPDPEPPHRDHIYSLSLIPGGAL